MAEDKYTGFFPKFLEQMGLDGQQSAEKNAADVRVVSDDLRLIQRARDELAVAQADALYCLALHTALSNIELDSETRLSTLSRALGRLRACEQYLREKAGIPRVEGEKP